MDNRNLTDPATGETYNAPIAGETEGMTGAIVFCRGGRNTNGTLTDDDI